MSDAPAGVRAGQGGAGEGDNSVGQLLGAFTSSTAWSTSGAISQRPGEPGDAALRDAVAAREGGGLIDFSEARLRGMWSHDETRRYYLAGGLRRTSPGTGRRRSGELDPHP
ncbi:MAG: hypothetical protein IPN17_38130 [Deltaproteobacteria bacterium]|nr:hypothetical protein [Deltaproteobacteria bacterium]